MTHEIIVYRNQYKTTSGKIIKGQAEYSMDVWGSANLSKVKWKQWAEMQGAKIKFKESPKKVIYVNS